MANSLYSPTRLKKHSSLFSSRSFGYSENYKLHRQNVKM